MCVAGGRGTGITNKQDIDRRTRTQRGRVGADRQEERDTDRRNRHTNRRGIRTKAIFFKVTDMRLFQLEMRQSRKVS